MCYIFKTRSRDARHGPAVGAIFCRIAQRMTGMPRTKIRPSAEGGPPPPNLANSIQPLDAAGLGVSQLEYMLQLLRDGGATKGDKNGPPAMRRRSVIPN